METATPACGPLIVGAGPVGLTAAVTLRKQGIACRIIDKATTPASQSRAAVIHARTLETLERLGLADQFVAAGVRIDGAVVRSDAGTTLVDVRMRDLPTEYAYFLGLNQAETERLLTAELQRLGGTIERGLELISLGQDHLGTRATRRRADGSHDVVAAPYLLGCDGGKSTVRHLLELPFEGETLDTQWLTADVRIDWDFPGDRALGYLSTHGLAFIARMDHERWRVIVNAPSHTRLTPENVTLEMVQDICSNRFGMKLRLHDPAWISPFAINTRMVPTLQVERIFLAGDAGHVHSPVGGQGMNTGIQDAFNLAWKLGLVLQGRADDILLDSYNAERHANARRLLAFVGPATRMVNLQGPVAVTARNAAMRMAGLLGAGGIMARRMSELDIHYRESVVVDEHLATIGEWMHAVTHHEPHPGLMDCWDFGRGPRPGERAPDAHGLVPAQGGDPTRLHGYWAGDLRHQVLIFTGLNAKTERLKHFESLAAQIQASCGEMLRVELVRLEQTALRGAMIDTDKEAHHAYGARYECLYLVRPDGYVGFRCQPAELEPLARYLGGIYRW